MTYKQCGQVEGIKILFACKYFIFPMARLANIFPSSCNTFDPRSFLTCCDVTSNKLGLIVTFHCTIQFGESEVHIPEKL